MKRKCFNCQTPIVECMGSALPRDICAAIDGIISWKNVREICQLCGHRMVKCLEKDLWL